MALSSEPDASVPTVVPSSGRTLADLPSVVVDLEAAGQTIRLTDRTAGQEIAEAVSRAAFAIVEAGVAIIARRFDDDQRLLMRVRVDGDELVLSMQSSGLEGLGQRGLVPDVDRRIVGERIAAAHGRLALRRTASGNWMAVVVLPLR